MANAILIDNDKWFCKHGKPMKVIAPINEWNNYNTTECKICQKILKSGKSIKVCRDFSKLIPNQSTLKEI